MALSGGTSFRTRARWRVSAAISPPGASSTACARVTSAGCQSPRCTEATAMETNPREMLRIAVLGAGHWGPNLIRNFHNHQTSEVAWVVDRDEGRLALTQSRYPEIRMTADA